MGYIILGVGLLLYKSVRLLLLFDMRVSRCSIALLPAGVVSWRKKILEKIICVFLALASTNVQAEDLKKPIDFFYHWANAAYGEGHSLSISPLLLRKNL